MPHRRILAVLTLAALTSLSPALAQTRPARAERTAGVSLLNLLLHRLAQVRAKVLGGDTTDSGSRLDPDGALTDGGSGLDPDGAR